MVIDQLGQVFIAGHHNGGEFFLSRLNRQRANHIIGLHPIHHNQWPAQGLHGLKHGWNLGGQIFRHGRPIGLVFGINRIPEGGAFGIKDTGHVM